MRPEILFPLFAPVTSLKGVGPRLGKLFEQLGIEQVVDLLWHVPTDIIDRRFQPKIADAPAGAIATMTVTVEAHEAPHNPRQPYRVRCRDETGTLFLVFFHGASRLPGEAAAARRDAGGERPGRAFQQPNSNHPSRSHSRARGSRPAIADRAGLWPYRGTEPAGRAEGGRRRALARAANCLNGSTPPICSRENWLSWRQALGKVHAPEDRSPTSRRPRRRGSVSPSTSCWRTNWRSRLMREHVKHIAGPRPGGDGRAAPQGDRHAALPASPIAKPERSTKSPPTWRRRRA